MHVLGKSLHIRELFVGEDLAVSIAARLPAIVNLLPSIKMGWLSTDRFACGSPQPCSAYCKSSESSLNVSTGKTFVKVERRASAAAKQGVRVFINRAARNIGAPK